MSIRQMNEEQALAAIAQTEDLLMLQSMANEEHIGESREKVLAAITARKLALQYDVPGNENENPLDSAPASSPAVAGQPASKALDDRVFGSFEYEESAPGELIQGEVEDHKEPGVIRGLFSVVIRGRLRKDAMCWLPRDIEPGEQAFLYRGKDYRHIAGSPNIAITFDPKGYGDFFEVPKMMLEYTEQDG